MLHIRINISSHFHYYTNCPVGAWAGRRGMEAEAVGRRDNLSHQHEKYKRTCKGPLELSKQNDRLSRMRESGELHL